MESAWLSFAANIEPAPFLLGDQPTVLDVYVAMISRRRLGRAWLTAHCPNAMSAVTATEAHPSIAATSARHSG